MLGAIVGDIVGSPYEFDENNIKTTKFPLFTDKSVFTDDTVMTVAVARALMDTYGSDDATIENALTMQMRALGRNYPARGYGGMFQAWLLVDTAEAYNSYGNGSAMRVAAAGWLYRTLEETLHAAELTARVTHNHPEGIKGAQAIAAAIFLARLHLPKDDIRAYLSKTFEYDLTRTLKEIRPTYKMDETCQGSVPEAITAFLEGNGFVDVIRKAVSIGGDSDTIACMAGSIAEAYYGIPEQVEKDTFQRLTPDLSATVLKFRRFYLDNSGTPLPGWEESVYYNPDEVLKGLKNLEFAISEFYIKSGSDQCRRGAGPVHQRQRRPPSAAHLHLEEPGLLRRPGTVLHDRQHPEHPRVQPRGGQPLWRHHQPLRAELPARQEERPTARPAVPDGPVLRKEDQEDGRLTF